MEDGTCVVGLAKVINLPGLFLLEVKLHARYDVGAVNVDVIVAVRTGLLVPETCNVFFIFIS